MERKVGGDACAREELELELETDTEPGSAEAAWLP